MKSDDPADHLFTLEALLLPPGLEVGTLASKPRPRPAGRFVKVPMEWVQRLSRAHTAATRDVALQLLDLDFKHRGRPFKLANGVLAAVGVTRHQKYRALLELTAIGLVEVEHRPRKSPIVTLLFPEEGQ